ncbi:MAG: sigma-70 family RNA polymerase sigma factor [Bacteroidales bacterium]
MNNENIKISDETLISRYVAGDNSAIEILINRHKTRIFTYLLMILKNRDLAEDIFQETFIKIIKSLKRGKYQDNGKFVSWAIRIAHNLVIDHYRKMKLMNTLSNDESDMDIFNSPKFSDSNVEDIMIEDQITSDVQSLVERLPEDQREVVIMRHYLDMSFKEIAIATDVSINTALGRMRYAIINLRKMMKEKDISLSKY